MATIAFNGTDISIQEWRDVVFLWYGIDPPDLPHHCDGSRVGLSINHALACKKGGLVTYQHNELCGGVVDLACKDLTPTHVRSDPLITPGRAVRSDRYMQNTSEIPKKQPGTAVDSNKRGDLLIRYLSERGTVYMLDMRAVNANAKSYQLRLP